VVDVGDRNGRRVAGIDVSDALDRDVEIERDSADRSSFPTKFRILKIAARHIPGATGSPWCRSDAR
jgi:hypothetical protein